MVRPLQIKYYMPTSNETTTKLLEKTYIVEQSGIKVFTTIAQLYRNTLSMCKGDRLNLQSDVSFLHVTNSFSSGNYVRRVVILKSGSAKESDVKGKEKYEEKGIFYVYFI